MSGSNPQTDAGGDGAAPSGASMLAPDAVTATITTTTTTSHETSNGGSTATTTTPVFLGTAPSASRPTTPGMPNTPGIRSSFAPLVCVVDFHHARGPEVEKWFGSPEGFDPAVEYDWSLLPFQALSDGAHASTEDFSYFTLLKPAQDDSPPTSLFGIACTRQLDASQLINRPPDVTRSTVQKAVVVIADSPQTFGMLRQRLSIVTCRWFEQKEFTTVEILEGFQESLADDYRRGLMNEEVDRDQYLGMSLRELVREFREKTLILVKCCLLQHKMLFFGTRCERLCMIQFSLISLIPGLLRNLQDCAGPELNAYAESVKKATTLRTSDRNSLLSYLGMPLQIFGKGSLFGPYTPLQQLDILADHETKSYIVGSTNSLLLQQRDRYSDILINLDDNTVSIGSPSLREALQLTTPDRRWIDFITQEVNDTWDEANPSQPKDMGYAGSEEFIRIQFEEYLLNMASSVKYHNFMEACQHNPRMALPHVDGDPSLDFGPNWISAWSRTENYRLWNKNTDSHIFDVNDPKHPCAGGLTIDDVQRRLAQQVQDLHLDERFAASKEVLGRNFQAGKERASIIFNKLYADMETMREAQRRRAEEAASQPSSPGPGSPANGMSSGVGGGVDLSKAQQTMQSVGAKASSYVSSWASWAGEKRKGWGRPSSGSGGGHNSYTSVGTAPGAAAPTGGAGWGFGSGRSSRKSEEKSSFISGRRSTDSSRSKKDVEKEKERDRGRGMEKEAKGEKENGMRSRSGDRGGNRPLTQDSFGESILGSEDDGMSSLASPVKNSVSDTIKVVPLSPAPTSGLGTEVVGDRGLVREMEEGEEEGKGDMLREHISRGRLEPRGESGVKRSIEARTGSGIGNKVEIIRDSPPEEVVDVDLDSDPDDGPKGVKPAPSPQDEATQVWASG